MKKVLTGLLLLLSLSCFAQTMNTDSAFKAIAAKADSAGKLAKANSDSLTKLKSDYVTSIRIDSQALQLFIANIDSELYDHYIFNNCSAASGRVGMKINSGCTTCKNCSDCDTNWVAWTRFILVMLLLLLFWYISYKKLAESAMCRDMSYDKDKKPLAIPLRPYSFSRVQLFWWTLIIISCYTFCFAATGVLIPINSTAVLLLGLSVTVVTGGKLIDHRQVKSNPVGTRSQDEETKGFFTDILSDENGISIHRFQALLFNVLFGIGYIWYFVNSFFCTKQYPLILFTDWQLGLLGISSATYLAMKGTENNSDVNAKTGGGNAGTGGGNQGGNQGGAGNQGGGNAGGGNQGGANQGGAVGQQPVNAGGNPGGGGNGNAPAEGEAAANQAPTE